jgi:hypothetical protein
MMTPLITIPNGMVVGAAPENGAPAGTFGFVGPNP